MNPIFALLWSEPAQAAKVAAGLDASAWQTVDRQARQHRLCPLLHCRAVAGGWDIPPDCADSWRASYRRSGQRALAQKATLARIGRSLHRGGVAAAVLKGGAYLWSGTIDPAVRPMRDIDVLVRPGDAERASALLRAAGFRQNPSARPSGKHLPAFTLGRVVLELHLRVLDTLDAAEAAREAGFVERAWQRKVASAVPGMQALCPTDTLLHLILHAVLDHQFNNGPLLLVDIPALVESGGVDWALLWQEAARLEAIRACQLALALAERFCGLAVEWHGHAPSDLAAEDFDRAVRLMLVDMTYRSAVGWPGHLLRVPPHRWPAQVRTLLQRRSAAAAPAGSTPGLAAAFSHAVGAEGRARIADAVRLSFWLRR